MNCLSGVLYHKTFPLAGWRHYFTVSAPQSRALISPSAPQGFTAVYWSGFYKPFSINKFKHFQTTHSELLVYNVSCEMQPNASAAWADRWTSVCFLGVITALFPEQWSPVTKCCRKRLISNTGKSGLAFTLIRAFAEHSHKTRGNMSFMCCKRVTIKHDTMLMRFKHIFFWLSQWWRFLILKY